LCNGNSSKTGRHGRRGSLSSCRCFSSSVLWVVKNIRSRILINISTIHPVSQLSPHLVSFLSTRSLVNYLRMIVNPHRPLQRNPSSPVHPELQTFILHVLRSCTPLCCTLQARIDLVQTHPIRPYYSLYTSAALLQARPSCKPREEHT
jgi:hypothetical protein